MRDLGQRGRFLAVGDAPIGIDRSSGVPVDAADHGEAAPTLGA